MGLLTTSPAERGTRVVVKLPDGAGGSMMMACNVAHCRAVADGLVSLGLEFVEELKGDDAPQPPAARRGLRVPRHGRGRAATGQRVDKASRVRGSRASRTSMKIPLQAFAQVVSALQRPARPATGRRSARATRMNIETPVSVTLLARDSGPRTIKAISRDISQSGLGLIMGSRPRRPATASSSTCRASPQPAMLMLAVVKLCIEPCDGVFKVGVEFLKELTERRAAKPQVQRRRRSSRIQRSVLERDVIGVRRCTPRLIFGRFEYQPWHTLQPHS